MKQKTLNYTCKRYKNKLDHDRRLD